MPIARRRPLALALLLALVACSTKDEAASAAAVGDAPAPPPAAAVQTEAALASDDDRTASVGDTEVSARMVIRNARIELRSATPAEVVARAIRLAEQAGGFVAHSDANGVGEEVDRASATLRVPSTAFESVLDTLRREGEVLVESLGGQDVTDQYVDLTARLRSQKALEERLLSILDGVAAVEDALRVETELTRVRTEIERLDAQRRTLEDRVSFATVDLVVSSPVRHTALPAETVSSRLDRALDDAGEAFVAVLAGTIRAVGGLLPLMLLFTPLGIALRRLWRRRRPTALPPA